MQNSYQKSSICRVCRQGHSQVLRSVVWTCRYHKICLKDFRQSRCGGLSLISQRQYSSQLPHQLLTTQAHWQAGSSASLALVEISHAAPLTRSSHDNPDEKSHLWVGIAQVFTQPLLPIKGVSIPIRYLRAMQPLSFRSPPVSSLLSPR